MQRLFYSLRPRGNTSPRTLRYHYLALTALSSAIDDRLFLSCGKVLAAGGPAAFLLSEALSCIMLYCAIDPLTEMMLYQPLGSFVSFAYHYIDPAWAFTVGWVYVFHCLMMVPLEIIAAAHTTKASLPSISFPIWISVFVLAISTISCLTAIRFAQVSVLLGLTKIVVVIGLGLLATSLAGRQTYAEDFRPFQYWKSPGSFNGGLFGAAGALFFSGTSASGFDIFSLGAQESDLTPNRVRPVSRAFFWTLATLRIFNAVAAGVEAPFTDQRLLDSTSAYTPDASPLAISLQSRGVPEFVFIFLRIHSIALQLSKALIAIFGESRAASMLATQRQAPRLFAWRDNKGRPWAPLLIGVFFALLGYMALWEVSEQFLTYTADLGGIPILLVHLTIFVAHIRFRRGLGKQGRDISGIDYRYSTGLLGSYFGIFFSFAVVFCQLWTGLKATGYEETLSVELMGFTIMPYIYIPVLVILYTSYKMWHRSPWRRSTDMEFMVL